MLIGAEMDQSVYSVSIALNQQIWSKEVVVRNFITFKNVQKVEKNQSKWGPFRKIMKKEVRSTRFIFISQKKLENCE